MPLHPSQLDIETAEYLAEVASSHGRCVDGVFVPLNRGMSPSFTRGMLVLAGACIASAILFLLPGVLESSGVLTASILQALLLGVAGGCLWNCWRRKTGVTHFLFADSLHIWDYSPKRVTWKNIERLQGAGGSYRVVKGGFSNQVFLNYPGEDELVQFESPRLECERLAGFLARLASLRNSEDEQLSARIRANPALAGAVAAALADGLPSETEVTLDNVPLRLDPHRPTHEIPNDAIGAVREGSRTWQGWLVGFLIFLVGFGLLFLLDSFILDAAAYKKARETPGVQGLDQYISTHPNGFFASDAGELRDDRRYASAEASSDWGDPQELRVYLADASNTRHRERARSRWLEHFDQAVNRLKERARQGGKEPRLLEPLLAILDAIRESDRLVITVRFNGSTVPEPEGNQEREEEAEILKEWRRVKPEMANKPVFPLGETFSGQWVKARERVLARRVQGALADILGQTLIAVEPTDGQAFLEVKYHLSPRGFISYFEESNMFGGKLKDRPIGFLRRYEIDWTVSLNPPGGQQAVWSTTSAPASELRIESTQGDPSWAPMAVILYSAFYDMAGKLVSEFGLTSPKAPTTFTFATASGR